MPPTRKVELQRYRQGDSYGDITAEITDGKLILSSCDGGPEIEEDWGDYDIEWFVIVAPEHKPAVVGALGSDVPPPEQLDTVLLTLLADRYLDDPKAVSRFRDLLDSAGIPYQFQRW